MWQNFHLSAMMSQTDTSKKKDPNTSDRLASKNELALLRNYFGEPDEKKVCSRAVRTLHFLCPEVAGKTKTAAKPEGIN